MNKIVSSSSKPVLPETIDDLAALLQIEMTAAAQELLTTVLVLEDVRTYFDNGTKDASSDAASSGVVVLKDPKPLYDKLTNRICRPGQAYMKGAAFHPSVPLPEAARLAPESYVNGNGTCERRFCVGVTYNQSMFGALEVTFSYRRDRFEFGNINVKGIPPEARPSQG